ncbi:uncharacterized protein LOC105803317 isoform X2 [Gossypium raimondii]|uniref:G domain-containing protein n=1 Tax=Gossypium raimondii TaxID=29730 RepID=A0A0D2SE54_GOSRA|nr:uncharacterized protein LOC105803317 isoform X2 [Gossypium raimondii]KJB42539.1 hypothetical protein B456_007G157000 [Gossypium raimondii]
MGGETIIPPTSTSEEEYSVDQDFPLPSLTSLNPTLLRDYLRMKAEDGKNESDRLFLEEFDKMGPQSSSPDFEAYHKRRQKVYKEVLQSYDQLRVRSKSLNEAKYKVLSYFPGTWIENVGGKKLSDYDVPKTTSLLLIGPKGCGKSSLVNKISRVLEDDNFAPERAQISYNPSVGDGTYYLQGYMIPRGSASFCLYDSRGLADGTSENINMIQNWMNNGVRHGEPVISLRRKMKFKPRELDWKFCRPQMVNFVIFVVDAVSVLKSIEGDGVEDLLCLQMISEVFKQPCLSFKDDKPVVVITHGDLLSIADRVRARVYLGELLGIPPAKQIFDIPENHDPVTELTIVDMLRYSLEHADRNLPYKNWVMENVRKVPLFSWLCVLAMLLGIASGMACMRYLHMRHPRESELNIVWHTIRHIW